MMISPKTQIPPDRIDVLRGAAQIAHYLSTSTARVYRLHSKRQIPTFFEGGIVCARKSTLVAWIEGQEAR